MEIHGAKRRVAARADVRAAADRGESRTPTCGGGCPRPPYARSSTSPRPGSSRCRNSARCSGWPAASTFHKYKAGDHGALTFDTLTRLSLLIGIYKSLQVLYPEPAFADTWPRMPNSHALFGGRPALTLMTDGGIDGLFRVRRLLDSRRGGWS